MSRRKQNLLDLTPQRVPGLQWEQAGEADVVLLRPNRGVWNRLARLLYAAPKQTRIRLDALGAFVWLRLDGTRTVSALAQEVSGQFGPAAEPLYPRLAQYLQALRANGFITF